MGKFWYATKERPLTQDGNRMNLSIMDRISDERKCMASLAVFRSLYNEEKDLYAIIADFAKKLIAEKSLRNFELQEMCYLFEESYGFDLPSAVIKTSLKRLKKILDIRGTFYKLKVGNSQIEAENVGDLEKHYKAINDNIFSQLLHYVEKNSSRKFSNIDIDKLNNAFCSYVIDEDVKSEFKDLISSFIISRSDDEEFKSQLNHIKQGVIIYVGLAYNANYDRIDGIDSQLNIYLDTEILFHMAGYNGTLFKTLFQEFFDLVKQINKKKKLISLLYFDETSTEIHDYFKIAEDIKRGRKQLDPSRQAMKYIDSMCKDASDVIEMEAVFFRQLEDNGIRIDNQRNYYDSDKYSLTIEHNKFLNQNNEGWSEEDVARKLKLLNYISIKRGGKSQELFRNIGHILLSGNSLTFKIAFDEDVRQKGNVPLATSLDFLTNRFWLIAEGGFQKKLHLKSFDILTKAQIVLSTSICRSVAQKYKTFEEEERKGTFDINTKKEFLANLHSHSFKPEDIISCNQDSYLQFLNASDINEYIATKEIQKKEEERKSAKRLEDIQDYATRIIERSLGKENDSIKKQYVKELESYKKARKKWVQQRMWIQRSKSFFVIAGFVAFVIIAIYLTAFSTRYPQRSRLIALFVAAIPFLLFLLKRQKIVDSFYGLFNRKIEFREMRKFLWSFSVLDNRPTLRLKTREDIEKELGDIESVG